MREVVTTEMDGYGDRLLGYRTLHRKIRNIHIQCTAFLPMLIHAEIKPININH